MQVPHQVDPHTGVDAANDPALMAVCHVGAGHPGSVPQGHRRISVSVRCHRQVHQVAGSNPYGQDQQAIHSQVRQDHHLQVWGSKHDDHRQWVPVYQ
jgi:hypothetical protein